PVFRATRRVSVLLPESFLGQELHVYGMVCDERGRWSETLYVPMGREEEEEEGEEGIEGEAVESAVACGREVKHVDGSEGVPGEICPHCRTGEIL
ncbi:MAG: hypothetical protein IK058_02510, partial [Bacteroidales bacterium]|nr:hypothetical protein [Bacteroidales bacterium]